MELQQNEIVQLVDSGARGNEPLGSMEELKFLDRRATVTFPRKAPLHGVSMKFR
jgi:hypothetical protein